MGGEGLVLIDAVVVIRRILDEVFLQEHELVFIQVVIPILRFGNIRDLGDLWCDRERSWRAGEFRILVFKVVIPVFWMGDGMSQRGGGARFGPLL